MTTETKHTNPPWEWSGRQLLSSQGTFSECVLIVEEGKFEPNQADAKLIAASPELLEALDTAKVWMEEFNDNGRFERPLQEIRSAIAKATK